MTPDNDLLLLTYYLNCQATSVKFDIFPLFWRFQNLMVALAHFDLDLLQP